MPALQKIVVIGPECTGKSTLSAALAERLGAVWVPEFARGYIDKIDRPYEEPDLLVIAQGQIAAEDAAVHAVPSAHLVVCDTDLYVLKVWAESAYGRCDHRILELIATRPCAHYLLTNIDVPWSFDPQREHPEAHQRQYFYHQYRDIVQQSGSPWTSISGSPEERLSKALEAIDPVRASPAF